MQEIIRVSDVEKYYGNGDQVTKAVDRVSFAVQAGGVYRCDGSFRFRKNNAFKSVVNH